LDHADNNKEVATISRLAAMRVAVFAVTSLAETRASGSGKRFLRLQQYAMALTQELKRRGRFAMELTDSFTSDLFQAIPMYDIGKIGIPDWILLKPNSLTPEEFEIIKTHTTLARDAIELAEKTLGYQAQTLRTMKETAYSHHEKWDGSGYPQGLAGERIPLSARLMAIADVYDALVSNKVYRDGVPHEAAVQVIVEGRNKHFDPQLVDAFNEINEEFRLIAKHGADSDVDMQKKIEYLASSIADETEVLTIVGVPEMPWS
jgi:putative two-component system response regulator